MSLALQHSVIEYGLIPGSLIEADLEYRENGAISQSGLPISDHPICFVRSYHLMQEIENARDYHTTPGIPNVNDDFDRPITFSDNNFKWVIHKLRDCDEKDTFIEWQQGYSPKEHVEMNLLVKQKAYLDEQRRLDLEWREKQEQIAGRRHWREIFILGFGATLALIAATILASAIQAYWIPKWFGLGG